MSVTKRDFDRIAEIMRVSVQTCPDKLSAGPCYRTIKAIGLGLAMYFATQNPRFRSDHFINACGLNGEPGHTEDTP